VGKNLLHLFFVIGSERKKLKKNKNVKNKAENLLIS